MTPQLTTQTERTASESDGPSRDEIFTALSNRRRRNVITYLKRHGDDARVRDIAEQLAAWENDLEINEVSYKQRKRVYTALHQSHLPKLSESGFIAYESDRGIVSLTEESRQLDVYLEIVAENDILWSEYYVGLAVVCGLLGGAAAIGTVPFAAVSGYVYAVLFAVLFGVSGLVHRTVTRRNRVG
jgi:DNA-binding transcriptional ArsR family regulator